MLDIKEELEILLLKKRTSMRKISEILRDKGYDIPKPSGLSYQLVNKRIRFQTVQEILDYLGYKIEIKEK